MQIILVITIFLMGIVGLYRAWLLDKYFQSKSKSHKQTLFEYWIDSSFKSRSRFFDWRIIKHEKENNEIARLNVLAFFLYLLLIVAIIDTAAFYLIK